MTFHPLVWVFLIAWTVLLGGTLLDTSSPYTGFTLENVFFVVIPWCMAVPSFYVNVRTSKELLLKCLGIRDAA